ncbi:MAG: response regulator, partial [Terriglobales bacterium]
MPAVAAAEPELAAPVQAGRILIVDDEAAIRESLEALFRIEAFEVSTASDAELGWQRFQADIFDLVLLDVALPAANGAPSASGGLELLRRLRAGSSVPVIMISAYATVEMAVEAMRAGAQTFLQKPWSNEKLLADVRSAIAAARVSQENVQLKRALKQRY